MTYQLRLDTLTAESFQEYDDLLYAPRGEQPKPRSRGTGDLMRIFGASR